MKIKILFLILISLITSNCSKEDNVDLKLSEDSFQVNGNAIVLDVKITSGGQWNAGSDATWCKLDRSFGKSGETLTISVSGNNTNAERHANITISSDNQREVITISQSTVTNYILPIIFNVIYSDISDDKQYVPSEKLSTIIKEVNKIYKNPYGSEDTNIQFFIKEVKYTKWDKAYPIESKTIMNNNKREYNYLTADQNQYINILLFNFEDSQTLGASHLPYTIRGNELPGLKVVDGKIAASQLPYPHCISINSSYIYNDDFNSPSITITHELSHYLGTFHVFAESDGYLDNSDDTDYCSDTPSYNRIKYEAYFNYVTSNYEPEQGPYTFDNLVKRTDGNGNQFISYNIMDYYLSYNDCFSKNQCERMHHVLQYSPLIPTSINRRSKAISGEILDLPMRIIE